MAGDGSSSCPLAGDHIFSSRFSCQVAGGGGVLNGELVGDRTMSHVPSLVDLLQRFNYYAVLPRCGMSVKSHYNGQQLGLGVLFHLY